MFEDGNVDELKVAGIGRTVPKALPKLDPLPVDRRKTGIGDIFEDSISVVQVIVRGDEIGRHVVEKKSGDAGIVEDRIDDIIETMVGVVGIGLDGAVRVAVAGVAAAEAAAALAVLKNNDLSAETVGVGQDSLDQAAHDVAVGRAPILPLGIDLDEDDVIGVDEAGGAAEGPRRARPIEFKPPASHEGQQAVNAGVIFLAGPEIKRQAGHAFDPEDVIQNSGGIPGLQGAGERPQGE